MAQKKLWWCSSKKMRSLELFLRRLPKMILIGMLLLNLPSCVAQQADLVRFQQEFDTKIAKLDQEKKALAVTLAQANQAIQESQTVLAKQKSEVSELVKARAQLNSDLRSLREENLPKLSGELESESHRSQRLEKKVDDLVQEAKNLKVDLEKANKARTAEIVTLRDNVQKEFDRQGKTMSDQMGGFRASLVEFKEALAGIDTRLVAEQTRASAAESKMKNEVEAQQAALQGKLDSDTQTLKQYLETDVETSIGSVAKTLQEVNATLGKQIDGQGAELKAQAALLSDLNTKVGTELASLKEQNKGARQNLESLTQSMTQFRNGLDAVSVQLGSKVDEHGQSLEQSGGRLKQVESQYASLSKKFETDTQILKADLQQARTQMASQDKHIQDLNQSVVSMREVLDSMAGMLGKRSDDQLQQMGKLSAQLEQVQKAKSQGSSQLDANLQALSSHVNEVTANVQSVVTALDQVKNSFSSRLDAQAAQLAEQERRLTETANNLPSSEIVNQELQANVQHLNQLTTSLAKLKEVVNTIGSKLGKKVDEHESQIAGLAQQVQQLQPSLKGSTSKSSAPK
jgi:chromosome segregation ATPase